MSLAAVPSSQPFFTIPNSSPLVPRLAWHLYKSSKNHHTLLELSVPRQIGSAWCGWEKPLRKVPGGPKGSAFAATDDVPRGSICGVKIWSFTRRRKKRDIFSFFLHLLFSENCFLGFIFFPTPTPAPFPVNLCILQICKWLSVYKMLHVVPNS